MRTIAIVAAISTAKSRGPVRAATALRSSRNNWLARGSHFSNSYARQQTMADNALLRVGTVEEVTNNNCTVVRGREHPIAVFYDGGKIKAVDNRCPHMGFPLSKGGVHEGILTCYWHHARFDLASGCAFD